VVPTPGVVVSTPGVVPASGVVVPATGVVPPPGVVPAAGVASASGGGLREVVFRVEGVVAAGFVAAEFVAGDRAIVIVIVGFVVVRVGVAAGSGVPDGVVETAKSGIAVRLVVAVGFVLVEAAGRAQPPDVVHPRVVGPDEPLTPRVVAVQDRVAGGGPVRG
jgi:hypothetical protein